ncbi:hypothetical protein AAC387_Pa07g3135 [Persea americana]
MLSKGIEKIGDPRFTRRFWTELFKLMGSDLHFSNFHPQTDGQMELINALLELYLRQFVSANQKDWVKLLDVAQFSLDAYRKRGIARMKREHLHGLASTNQSFVHFRWW